MPGIDQRTPNFNSAPLPSRQESVPHSAITQPSLAAKIIFKQNVEQKTDKNLETKEAINNLLTQKAEQEKTNHEIKKQKSAQVDGFSKADPTNPNKQNLSVSQYAAEISEKKQRQQETQKLAKNINDSQIGQARSSINNPQAKTSSQDAQTSALVAQAHVDSVDPDSTRQQTPEEKEAYALLEDIEKRGLEKGKSFAAFARREIGKGRLAEIKDLIVGYQKTLKGTSLTPSEMIEKGEETLLVARTMVSSDNPQELAMINNQIVVRPDASATFKIDQLLLRNRSAGERISPPSFYKPTQLSILEQTIRFVSTINNSVLPAPWDRVA
jgi:hypothetical protein